MAMRQVTVFCALRGKGLRNGVSEYQDLTSCLWRCRCHQQKILRAIYCFILGVRETALGRIRCVGTESWENMGFGPRGVRAGAVALRPAPLCSSP
jgi:hypothetical protein